VYFGSLKGCDTLSELSQPFRLEIIDARPQGVALGYAVPALRAEERKRSTTESFQPSKSASEPR
jgi:hypothetical protein